MTSNPSDEGSQTIDRPTLSTATAVHDGLLPISNNDRQLTLFHARGDDCVLRPDCVRQAFGHSSTQRFEDFTFCLN